MAAQKIRFVNIGLTLIGSAVFIALLLYINLAPKDFDKRTRDFAIAQVENKVEDQLSGVANSETADRISEFSGQISERLQSRVDQARASLDSDLDQFIADILAAACKLDCERRDEAAAAVRNIFENSILRNSIALERLQELVEGEYDDVMDELRADLSVFSGSNAFALLFALLLALFRGKAAAHLLPVSLALTAATILAVLWYALGQDWVMTVLYSNYWGWSYSILLAILCLLMADIAANKARVTSFIFNGIGNMFGGAFHLSPC